LRNEDLGRSGEPADTCADVHGDPSDFLVETLDFACVDSCLTTVLFTDIVRCAQALVHAVESVGLQIRVSFDSPARAGRLYGNGIAARRPPLDRTSRAASPHGPGASGPLQRARDRHSWRRLLRTRSKSASSSVTEARNASISPTSGSGSSVQTTTDAPGTPTTREPGTRRAR
jgi:hypothetical protein